ncbi:MAG: uncharacterized protein KVP18_004045 [Porospora cf. gigantea A]|uniref:uncharacterized protein n=1 Tax=Porospora cf. gigantea A TaxID=2853593 RepID=UPI00355A4060|nr:MAG: hypothetical protein KVP18_004045 [Porospora cf. gigantea A]
MESTSAPTTAGPITETSTIESTSAPTTAGPITETSTSESTSAPTTAGPISDVSTIENTSSGSNEPPDAGCILRKVNFNGNDIQRAVKVADLAECVSICHSIHGCKFITLAKVRKQRYCHLKSSDVGEEVKAGYVSMRMSCLSESTSAPTTTGPITDSTIESTFAPTTAGPITDDSAIESTSAPTTAGPISDVSTIENTSSDSTPPDAGCILRDINYNCNDIQRAVKVADLAECVSICHSIQGCQFITLATIQNQRYCHVKWSDVGEEVKAGYVSMRMSCLDTPDPTTTVGPITDDSTIESTSVPATVGPISDVSTIENTSSGSMPPNLLREVNFMPPNLLREVNFNCHDIQRAVKVADLAECVSLCHRIPGCRFITLRNHGDQPYCHVKWSDVGEEVRGGYVSMRMPYLPQDTPDPTANVGPITDDSTIESTSSGSTPPDAGCTLREVNFSCNDIQRAVKVADLAECVSICHSIPGCKFITLAKVRNQRYCHLKSSDVGEEVRAGYVSMRMSCLSEGTSGRNDSDRQVASMTSRGGLKTLSNAAVAVIVLALAAIVLGLAAIVTLVIRLRSTSTQLLPMKAQPLSTNAPQISYPLSSGEVPV